MTFGPYARFDQSGMSAGCGKVCLSEDPACKRFAIGAEESLCKDIVYPMSNIKRGKNAAALNESGSYPVPSSMRM